MQTDATDVDFSKNSTEYNKIIQRQKSQRHSMYIHHKHFDTQK